MRSQLGYGYQPHLMPDDEDVLLSLELHDDRLQTDDHIAVRLASSIPIVEFVLVPTLVVLWIFVLRVSCIRQVIPTSISSYVMPSHTPASSSSSDFQVFFSKGR